MKYTKYSCENLPCPAKKSLAVGHIAIIQTRPNLTFDDLCNFAFPLPALQIQSKIVDEINSSRLVISGARTVIDNYKPSLPQVLNAEYKQLETISTFRPSINEIKHLPDDTDVSFVPMADLNTFDISFEAKDMRKLMNVRSGFTYFKDNDVLLAKITPCFENGKAGVARNLINGIGFGSTEYIVIRADTSVVYPEWIFYHINTQEFLHAGKAYMTGTAGQQRIDLNFVKKYVIPVPSLSVQKMILDKIQAEKKLIAPAKEVIEVFTKKIQDKVNEIWGD